MSLTKLAVSQVVASGTYLLHGFFRNKVRLARGMGLMATQAVTRGRRMHVLAMHYLGNPLVATQAKARALRNQKIRQFRFVRVVATRAGSLNRRLMIAYAIFNGVLDRGMALETCLALFPVEHTYLVAGVRVVTFQAKPFVKRHMVVANGLRFHESRVAL